MISSKYREISNKVFLSNGFTVSMRELSDYKGRGYIVALDKIYEFRVPLRLFSRENNISGAIIEELHAYYLKLYSYHDSLQKLYFGAWIDSDCAVFDISESYDDKHVALSKAKQRNQKAIYDFNKKEIILLKEYDYHGEECNVLK